MKAIEVNNKLLTRELGYMAACLLKTGIEIIGRNHQFAQKLYYVPPTGISCCKLLLLCKACPQPPLHSSRLALLYVEEREQKFLFSLLNSRNERKERDLLQMTASLSFSKWQSYHQSTTRGGCWLGQLNAPVQ